MYFKMNILFYVFSLLLFETVKPFESLLTCPMECVCDLVDEYRRVSCEYRNLVDIVNVPLQVNIFSLHGNAIQFLDNYCFENKEYGRNGFYENLIELDLSENRISDMAMFAFRGLKNLERINLSRNRLEQIYQYVFVYNEKLQEIDLSHNNFRRLKDSPIFKHTKLKVLNLSFSQIIQLHESTFSGLPYLEVLNLNGNNMVSLQINVLQTMTKLKSLSLNDNNWRCNLGFNEVQNWLLKRRIDFLTQCGTKKSEKMVLLPPKDIEEDITTERDLREVWKLFDDEEQQQEKKYQSKKENKSNVNTTDFFDTSQSFAESFNKKVPPFLSMVMGLLLGILIGMFTTYFWMSEICSCRKWKRRPDSLDTPRNGRRRRHLLLNNTSMPHADTPPLLRREISNNEVFLRSHSWETGPVHEPTTPRPRLILQDVNEMRYIPRPRAETPPPPYSDCANDNIVSNNNAQNINSNNSENIENNNETT